MHLQLYLFTCVYDVSFDRGLLAACMPVRRENPEFLVEGDPDDCFEGYYPVERSIIAWS